MIIGNASTSIKQRLPVELFKLTEKVIDELKEKYPDTYFRLEIKSDTKMKLSMARGTADTHIIEELFTAIYTRMAQMIELQRY